MAPFNEPGTLNDTLHLADGHALRGPFLRRARWGVLWIVGHNVCKLNAILREFHYFLDNESDCHYQVIVSHFPSLTTIGFLYGV